MGLIQLVKFEFALKNMDQKSMSRTRLLVLENYQKYNEKFLKIVIKRIFFIKQRIIENFYLNFTQKEKTKNQF